MPGGNRIDFRRQLRPIDGLGFAQAFQRATLIQALPAADRRAVLDLLLDRRTGAGASILRIGIGSSADGIYDHMMTIEPIDPGGPDATPRGSAHR